MLWHTITHNVFQCQFLASAVKSSDSTVVIRVQWRDELTYRVVERDAVLFEKWYCYVVSPRRWIARATKQHCV